VARLRKLLREQSFPCGFLLLLLVFASSALAAGEWHRHVKMKSSWPHLNGPRDMNYDHSIVPGVRVGPVSLGGSVTEAVHHLGNPDQINLSTFGGRYADEVYYHYDSECIQFVWQDEGIDPTVENGLRGIVAFCDRWSTSTGIHVGMTPAEAVSHLDGEYCTFNRDNGEIQVETRDGMFLMAKDRYSPIHDIGVVPAGGEWHCR